MLKKLKSFIYQNFNEENRDKWLSQKLATIPCGQRILDAGAGQLKNKKHCCHLNYVSQDFCQYEGDGNGKGLHTGIWDTSKIDISCDITNIPEPDGSFDAILCSEVLEHIPDPVKAIAEFSRLLKPDGVLILTAPFVSNVHFAPYHFCSGFSQYWYEHHLVAMGFSIEELVPNGDWFDLFHQEVVRFSYVAKKYNEKLWPLAFLLSLAGALFFKLRGQKAPVAHDLCCLGWHCFARKAVQRGIDNR